MKKYALPFALLALVFATGAYADTPDELIVAGDIRLVNYIGEPVVGALVYNDATGHTLGVSGADGWTTFDTTVPPTALLRLEDPNGAYMPRRILLGEPDADGGDPRIRVLLRPSENPTTYTKMLYRDGKMYKSAGTTYLVLAPELQPFAERLQRVADYWTSKGEPTVLGDSPDGSGQITRLRVDPKYVTFQGSNAGAVTMVSVDPLSGLSKTAEVVFQQFGDWDSDEWMANHEVGHVRSLHHHDGLGLMNANPTSTILVADELLQLEQRRHRKPLNVLLDNAPGTIASTSDRGQEKTLVFLCGAGH